MESTGKTRLLIQGRSAGDGMENTSFTEKNYLKFEKSNKNQNLLPDFYSKNFTSPGKRKEPKFIPYEPYKAAVSSIIPSPNKHEKIVPPKVLVNSQQEKIFPPEIVIDSQKVSSLASSIIQHNSKKLYSTSEEKYVSSEHVETSADEKKCSSSCNLKISALEKQVKQLEKEKKELESQFRIQTEVNADLKKMLIASLGEDMQLKVQYMTEDKARLGMNVLQFSEQLQQKNEEIDRLSVECDVWKSKFEASSLMVDDLAGWKVALTRKLNETLQAINSVFKEHEVIYEQLYTTYRILEHTLAAFEPSAKETSKQRLSPQSLIQLSSEVKSLSSNIQERLQWNPNAEILLRAAHEGIRLLTPAEKAAYQAVNNFDEYPMLLKGEPMMKGIKYGPGAIACQVLPHVCAKDTTVNCCVHCSGEIQHI
ncbi:golgin-45-like [Stegodyphus dumicola]|uniref:golgin-45-like n=1 Tax=Stegodyphus dumicola TaxID=202533 RepID=UPI0015AE71A0|nr:golgin-45-like [Stegodyphus dumicola]